MKSLYKMCAGHTSLPKSLYFELQEDPTGVVLDRGGFADVSKREYLGKEVAVKVLRTHHSISPQEMVNVGHWRAFIASHVLANRMHRLQRFCKEVITWKALRHPNVLPLLGVMMSENQFAMVSEWMTNGNIKQFIMSHQDANRFELVSSSFKPLEWSAVNNHSCDPDSWRMSQGA